MHKMKIKAGQVKSCFEQINSTYSSSVTIDRTSLGFIFQDLLHLGQKTKSKGVTLKTEKKSSYFGFVVEGDDVEQGEILLRNKMKGTLINATMNYQQKFDI